MCLFLHFLTVEAPGANLNVVDKSVIGSLYLEVVVASGLVIVAVPSGLL